MKINWNDKVKDEVYCEVKECEVEYDEGGGESTTYCADFDIDESLLWDYFKSKGGKEFEDFRAMSEEETMSWLKDNVDNVIDWFTDTQDFIDLAVEYEEGLRGAYEDQLYAQWRDM